MDVDLPFPSLAFKTGDLPEHRRGTCLGSLVKPAGEQWVKNVTGFSSQYSTGGSWSASNVAGPPRVFPGYGDNALAWTPRTLDAQQYLELEFEDEVQIEGIHIYETNVAGGVVEVLAKDKIGSWVTLWKGKTAAVIHTSRIFAPPLDASKLASKYIKLKVDCSVSRSWVEIDAVKLLGKQPVVTLPQATLSNLADSLCALLCNTTFSDVSFNVDQHIFDGHKGIIHVRCPKLFQVGSCSVRDGKECYSFDDIDSTTFMGILHYIYTAQIGPVVKPLHLAKIIKVCNQLDLAELKDICLSHLENELDVANVVEIYQTSFGEDTLADVREVCAEFIGSNMGDISKTEPFTNLPQHIMVELIQKSSMHLKRKAPASIDAPPSKLAFGELGTPGGLFGAAPPTATLGIFAQAQSGQVQSSPPEKA